MSQIYAAKKSYDSYNKDEIEDVDVILNKLKHSESKKDENNESSKSPRLIKKRISYRLKEIIRKSKPGALISTNQNGKFTLYIYIGEDIFMPLFSDQNGILPGFREFEKHMLFAKNLKTLIAQNTKLAADFTNDEEIITYKADIIDNINQSKDYLSTFESNLKVMHKLETGDIIDFNRGLYTHSAIFDKDGFKVIHRNGGPSSKSSAIVIEENLLDVMFQSKFFKNNHLDGSQTPRKPHEIIKYARERLGDEGYNLITENCQHFATECRYGEPQSHEVNKAGYFLTGVAVLGTLIGGYVFAKKKNQNKKEKENEF